MPTTPNFVQAPPDSTGKKLQTYENTVNNQVVESEAVTLTRSLDNTEVGTQAQPLITTVSSQSEVRELLYLMLLELRAVKFAIIQLSNGTPMSAGDADPSNFQDQSVGPN